MWSKSVWLSQIHWSSAGSITERSDVMKSSLSTNGVRVDEHRLGTLEDEGVHRDQPEPGDRDLRRDHVDVGCRGVGLHGSLPGRTRAGAS